MWVDTIKSLFTTSTYLIGILALAFSMWILVMVTLACIQVYGIGAVAIVTLLYIASWLWYVARAYFDVKHDIRAKP